MPKGKRYNVYTTLNVYLNAADAVARRNPRSTITDNSSSMEGAGTPYINEFSGWQNYAPAIPIWWVPSGWASGGWELGWINGDDNLSRSTIKSNYTRRTMGNALAFTITRKATSLKHTIKYEFEGQTGTIATGVNTNQNWTPPTSLASRIKTKTSGTLKIICETYADGKQIGTHSINITLTVPTYKPDISHALSGKHSSLDEYIKTISTLGVAATASGKYSSTIKTTDIKTTVSGAMKTGQTVSFPLTTAGSSILVKTEVEDSRGIKNTAETRINVRDYWLPIITEFNAWRVDNNGNAADNGRRLRLTAEHSIAPINNKNARTWVLSYREVGTSGWSHSSDDGTGYYDRTYEDYPTTGYMAGVLLDAAKMYEIRLAVGDSFNTSYAYVTIGTEFDIMNINASGKGLAIGMKSTDDLFQVGMAADFLGGLFVEGSPLGVYEEDADTNTDRASIRIGEIQIELIRKKMLYSDLIAITSSGSLSVIRFDMPDFLNPFGRVFYQNAAIHGSTQLRLRSRTTGAKFMWGGSGDGIALDSWGAIALTSPETISFEAGDFVVITGIAIGRGTK